MNPASQTLRWLNAVAIFAVAFGLCLPAHAAESSSESESRQFRVLDSQEVILGPRSIIYNRVETPPLLPQPAPVEKATTPIIEHTPTAEELAEMRPMGGHESCQPVSLLHGL